MEGEAGERFGLAPEDHHRVGGTVGPAGTGGQGLDEKPCSELWMESPHLH